MSFFRSEALEAKRRKLWGQVRLSQPPSLTIWTVLLGLVCLAVVALLLFGQFTRRETVQGFLYAEGGVVDVRPVQGGRISRVLVRQGETVTLGQPLVEFVSDVGGLETGPTLDAQIAEANNQLEAFQRNRAAIIESYRAERQRLEEQIRAQADLKSILVEQRTGQSDALRLTEVDLARITRLQAEGFAPSAEVDARRRAVLREQNALRDLEAEIAATDARVADLRSRVSALPSRQAETEARLTAESSTIVQQRAQLLAARGYIVRAPVSGTVTRVLVQDGVTPGNNGRILTIAPDSAMLYARLLVPTRAIGFIERGQPANIRVDAFPFQRFGMIRGYVSQIFATVVRPGDVLYPIEQKEAVYEVDVFITREHINAYGEERSLRPGMTLSADLPIDRRRLWQQLFDPLLAARARNSA
jgi:membrane fusion protein